jgi:hypothetical protein
MHLNARNVVVIAVPSGVWGSSPQGPVVELERGVAWIRATFDHLVAGLLDYVGGR